MIGSVLIKLTAICSEKHHMYLSYLPIYFEFSYLRQLLLLVCLS